MRNIKNTQTNQKDYQTEEEFLNDYNSDEFEKLSMTADIIVFSVSDGDRENYRRLQKKYFSVLLIKRNTFPFKGKWCLPGGFIDVNENIDDAAMRVLKRETNVTDIYMEQLYTFGKVNRDPRMRIVSTSYMSLIDKNNLTSNIPDTAKWFNIEYEEDKNQMIIKFSSDEEEFEVILKKVLKERTSNKFVFEIDSDTNLAFDHAEVIAEGISRLKNKANYTDVVFNMMPKYFTLGELQQVYEAILNKKLLDPAFRRIIADKVEKTEQLRKGAGHRPSYLYMYKENQEV